MTYGSLGLRTFFFSLIPLTKRGVNSVVYAYAHTDMYLRQPTALDALLFAYLHCLLNSPDIVRLDVARRTNLVEWERRVQARVKEAFVKE